MKIFVTGCAGYVGSVLVGDLLDAGHEVAGVDSLLHGSTGLMANMGRDRFSFTRADVRDHERIKGLLKGADAVVHLAAIVGDPACARDPQLATEVNLEAALRLFDTSRKEGASRFIFASTCSNYGRMADPTAYITEESELRPVSHYAETKVSFEKHLLSASADSGMAATVLRFATVFGLSPRMRFDLTVNEFTMELLTKKKLVIFGEQFWRPYIHVRDVARAVQTVLEAEPAQVRGNVFNVGDSRENYQKGQLVEMIREELGEEVEIERVERAEDPRDYRVSFEKINRELDFHTRRTVRDGIREVIQMINEGVISDFDNPAYRN